MKIYEHEIPNGSKLYFGNTARLKREIEAYASQILFDSGFSEIITPYLSYHQRLSVPGESLLRLSDVNNEELSLRADSTIDVARIIKTRIKNNQKKKWFYIQPVFKYPSSEIYQIGVEILESQNLVECVDLASQIFTKFELKPYLQISNIEIPKIICQILNLDIEIFEKGRLELLLGLNLEWLNRLLVVKKWQDIKEVILVAPNELKAPLELIMELGSNVKYQNLVYAPLYYSKMRYYDKLFFRFLLDNKILGSGGSYNMEMDCVGFAIYTDGFIESLVN